VDVNLFIEIRSQKRLYLSDILLPC